jgi:DNA-binding GntR family transcriptional regulator
VSEKALLSTSLVDRLTDQLKEMIMTGELGPDAPVNINAIAKEAAVSLVPVREALARLSASGLLQFRPNRGYRVSPRLTPEGREGLFEARELLELAAAPLAVENRDEEQMEELASLNQAMRKLSGKSRTMPQNFFRLNDKFHRTYVGTSANVYLVRFFDVLSFDLIMAREVTAPIDIKRLTAEHEIIIKSLKDRNLELLSKSLRNHIRSTRYSGSK